MTNLMSRLYEFSKERFYLPTIYDPVRVANGEYRADGVMSCTRHRHVVQRIKALTMWSEWIRIFQPRKFSL